MEDVKSTTEKLKEADLLDFEVPDGVVEDLKRMLVHYTDARVRNIDDWFKESDISDSTVHIWSFVDALSWWFQVMAL